MIIGSKKEAFSTPAVHLSPPSAAQGAPRITDGRLQKGLNASDRIGKYLVQGWALLDETCPSEECADVIPLLKNKSGRVCLQS